MRGEWKKTHSTAVFTFTCITFFHQGWWNLWKVTSHGILECLETFLFWPRQINLYIQACFAAGTECCCNCTPSLVHYLVSNNNNNVLVNALSACIIHINLNTIFYTYVEDSPTKTISMRHYGNAHTRTHKWQKLGIDISLTSRVCCSLQGTSEKHFFASCLHTQRTNLHACVFCACTTHPGVTYASSGTKSSVYLIIRNTVL